MFVNLANLERSTLGTPLIVPVIRQSEGWTERERKRERERERERDSVLLVDFALLVQMVWSHASLLYLRKWLDYPALYLQLSQPVLVYT